MSYRALKGIFSAMLLAWNHLETDLTPWVGVIPYPDGPLPATGQNDAPL